MKKIFLNLLLFSIISVFLGGCSFWPSSGKKEISLNDENIQKAEKNEAPLESSATSNASNISNDEKKPDANVSDSQSSQLKIIDKLVSWGFEKSSSRKIDTIIIHSSYNTVGSDPHDLADIIYKEYKPYGVSPHYIISRDGQIYLLVSEKNIAYHAGKSEVPDGRTNVNDFSIGIEIINTKSEKPNDSQYTALKNLLEDIKNRHKIKYVLGHSDIAPGRKDDPWNFDFNKVR